MQKGRKRVEIFVTYHRTYFSINIAVVFCECLSLVKSGIKIEKGKLDRLQRQEKKTSQGSNRFDMQCVGPKSS